MTRHQRHFRKFRYIPCTYNQSSAIRVRFNLFYQVGYLVNYFSIFTLPTAPLFAIHGTKFTVLFGPFIPNAYSIFFQILNIGLPFQEPKQFMDDAFCMNFFCSNKRKTFSQIKPHLVAKCANCTGAGSVMFLHAIIKNMLKQIEVLLHARKLIESDESWAVNA